MSTDLEKRRSQMLEQVQESRMAEDLVQLVPDGDTKIHAHPDSRDIWELLIAYTRMRTETRPTLNRLEQIMNTYWPELDLQENGKYVRTILSKYVVPNMVQDPGWIISGLIEKEIETDTTLRKGQIAKTLFEKYKDALNKVDDADSDITVGDVERLAKTALKAQKELEESLEKHGHSPEKVEKSAHLEMRATLDIDRLEDTMEGRDDAIEVDSREVDEDQE